MHWATLISLNILGTLFPLIKISFPDLLLVSSTHPVEPSSRSPHCDTLSNMTTLHLLQTWYNQWFLCSLLYTLPGHRTPQLCIYKSIFKGLWVWVFLALFVLQWYPAHCGFHCTFCKQHLLCRWTQLLTRNTKEVDFELAQKLFL
jgi:hypothetical protein